MRLFLMQIVSGNSGVAWPKFLGIFAYFTKKNFEKQHAFCFSKCFFDDDSLIPFETIIWGFSNKSNNNAEPIQMDFFYAKLI